MARLATYLTFDGSCAQAMNFYKQALGGELEMSKVADSPMASKMPPEQKDNVMHSRLSTDKIEIMASDMMGDSKLTRGNTMTLCLICESEQELKNLFDKLSQGANITQPVKEEFFGWFATLTDKFGVDWMFQADAPKK